MLYLIYSLVAVFAVYSKFKNENLYKLTKPLPLFLLIIFSPLQFHFNIVFFLFLVFSLFGDIALLGMRKINFICGLSSFLVAHIVLIIFFLRKGSNLDLTVFVIILLISSAYYLVALKNHIEKLKLPVILYLIVISIMVSVSFRLNIDSHILFTGASLFYISDALLAYNKFVKQNSFVNFFSIVSYYLAQGLLFYGFTLIN